jgi:hypothetical protein
MERSGFDSSRQIKAKEEVASVLDPKSNTAHKAPVVWVLQSENLSNNSQSTYTEEEVVLQTILSKNLSSNRKFILKPQIQ